MIWVKDLVKIYRGGVRALDGISFEMRRPGILAVIGPNGAGKTTLVRILSGLLKPTSGEVSVLGVNVLREPSKARRMVSLAPQDASPDFNLTPYEFVYWYCILRHGDVAFCRSRAREVLEVLGLWNSRNTLCKMLSGGQLKRTIVAAALSVDADIYILDEPTAGIDVAGRETIWRAIRRLIAEDRYVILTSHYMDEVEVLSDNVILLHRGRIVLEGSPHVLLSKLKYRYKIIVFSKMPKSLAEGLDENIKIVELADRCMVYVSSEESLYRVIDMLTGVRAEFLVRNTGLGDLMLDIVADSHV